MSTPPKIVFAGAATIDLIFEVDHLPTGAGKVLPHGLKQVAHGMATSAATAAARLGGRAVLITRIGDDTWGNTFLSEIEAEGVDCHLIKRFQGVRTPMSAVIVDTSGERLIVPYYDAALGSDANWIDEADISSADAVQVDVRWPQGAARVLDLAHMHGKIAVLDADVGPLDVIVDLAQRASHTVFSEPAAKSVSGQDAMGEVLRVLDARFPGFVAVTNGPEGCYWLSDGTLMQAKPPKVDAVDTLAAGDVFHGAFTLGLAEGQSIPDTIDFANIAAALSCTVRGGRLGAPTREQVRAATSNQII